MYKYILLPILSIATIYIIYGEDIQSKWLSTMSKQERSTQTPKEISQKREDQKKTAEYNLQKQRLQKEAKLANIEANKERIQLELKGLRDQKKSLEIALLEEKQVRIKREKEIKEAKRIAEAKRVKRIAEARARAIKAKLIAEAKAKERRRNRIVAHIVLSSQEMKVYKGEKLLHQWLVSTARKGYSTPTGNYFPQVLEKMHHSKLYHNSPMPYSIFFQGNYAIHGTESIGRLGRKASHGCVRLHPENAKVLYGMIQKSGKDNAEIKITY